jgi:hypothetical protein
MKAVFLLILSFPLWAQYQTVPTTRYPGLEAILNAKPAAQTGSGAPSGNCTTGKDFYIDTTAKVLYYCSSTNGWTKALSPDGSGNVAISASCPAGTPNGSACLSGIVTTTQTAGTEIVSNGNFVSGLSGWTIDNSGTDWSIVGGKLHHTPGAGNKISTNVTVVQGDAYLAVVTIDSVSGYPGYMDLGVDCNSDCTRTFYAGVFRSALASNSDNGSSVIELYVTDTTDITISSVSVLHLSTPFSRSIDTKLGPGAALHDPVTSFYNTVIGAGAAASMIGGNSNTAIGHNALVSNVTGYVNTAIGVQALSYQLGNGSVAIGGSALNDTANADFCTAVGVNAFESVDCTGSIGIIAGANSGGGALLAGSQKGVTQSVIIGALAHTVITNNAGTPTTNSIAINGAITGDNQTAIGNASTTSFKAFGAPIFPQIVSTPANSSATCTAGQLAFDTAYVYTCVSTNTWRRAATSSW